jgi:hypothetical protein
LVDKLRKEWLDQPEGFTGMEVDNESTRAGTTAKETTADNESVDLDWDDAPSIKQKLLLSPQYSAFGDPGVKGSAICMPRITAEYKAKLVGLKTKFEQEFVVARDGCLLIEGKSRDLWNWLTTWPDSIPKTHKATESQVIKAAKIRIDP